MLFSIIIPTYNRAHTLPETLRSVFDQEFDDYEVIVVDDGSTDGTREIVAALGNDKLRYYYKENEERSIARNYGADRAEGRYLLFLDSDDRITRNHLSEAARYLEKHAFEPQLLFAGYEIFNPDGTKLYRFSHDGIFDSKKLFFGNFLGCSSVFVSHGLFTKHRFNTDSRLILFEDWELWLRLASESPIHCIPSNSILMINHTGRSVLNYDHEQLISKILFFRDHVCSNITGVGRKRRTFLMGIYSYAALHIALNGQKKDVALNYLFKAVAAHPGFIFKRRFYGIIKQLF